MVVAFLADEGQDVVGGRVAADEEQVGGCVEVHGERVLLLRGDGLQGRGLGDERGFLTVGAPVDGVDGDGAAGPQRARGIAHGVVADGHTRVVGSLGGTNAGNAVEHLLRDVRADDVGRHHAGVGRVVHLAHQLKGNQRTLAEAGKHERASLVLMLQVVGEGAAHVAQCKRQALAGKAVALERLQRALAVVGSVEVQASAQQRVDALHLAEHGQAQAVGIGVGIVAEGAVGRGIVARLGGDDVEDVGLALAVGDVPLRRLAVVGFGGDVAIGHLSG